MKSFFLFIVMLMLFCRCDNEKNTNNEIDDEYAFMSRIDTTLIEEVYLKWIDIEGIVLDNTELFDIKGAKTSLYDIINKKCVILFFSESACDNCISLQISCLINFHKNSVPLDFVVISSSPNLRWLYSTMVQEQMEIQCFTTNYTDIGFDRQYHCGPLFFATDRNHKVFMAFEPYLQKKELTFKYFSKLSNCFFY